MEIIWDMGAHARYVWPAYLAFVVIFAGLYVWIAGANRRAKAQLDDLESRKDRGK